MTGYWAVNSTADDGRLAICPLCVWAPATLAWFEIGFFWECPSKSSSGTERDSTTTSIHSILVGWNAQTVRGLLRGLDAFKWQFSSLSERLSAKQLADNHNQNTVRAGEPLFDGPVSWELIQNVMCLKFIFVYLISPPNVPSSVTTRRVQGVRRGCSPRSTQLHLGQSNWSAIHIQQCNSL